MVILFNTAYLIEVHRQTVHFENEVIVSHRNTVNMCNTGTLSTVPCEVVYLLALYCTVH